MAQFFSIFPKKVFDNKLITDLLVRIKVRDTWLNSPKIYYEYIYKDHDRPEHIAKKYYGDETLHWLILITNNIFDVNFDLPMSSYVFPKYIEDKYKDLGEEVGKTGMEYAMTAVDPEIGKQKEITITYSNGRQQVEYQKLDDVAYENFNGYKRTFLGPDGLYITYEESLKFPFTTIYEREFQENEEKRKIKLLKKEYVGKATKELLQLLR